MRSAFGTLSPGALTATAYLPPVQLNAVLATSQALLAAAKDVRSALLLIWYQAISGTCPTHWCHSSQFVSVIRPWVR